MDAKQKVIIPHLWFDTQAKEAVSRYTSIFPNSGITSLSVLRDTPSGDCDLLSFTLWGMPFMAISAGPYFTFNPSISFIVNFDPHRSGEEAARAKLDEIWNALSDGGSALMPLGEYPFSKRFGWIKDRFGLTWQLRLTDPAGEIRPSIMPALLFTGSNCGKAEEAMDHYRSVFPGSKAGNIIRYGADIPSNKEGTVMFGDVRLSQTYLALMDNGYDHGFTFNEAVSFVVACDDQEEIDHYWGQLSSVPEAEQCGWCRDRFGVSWQITPSRLNDMMSRGTPEQIARVTKAFLGMKKFDIAALEQAFKA